MSKKKEKKYKDLILKLNNLELGFQKLGGRE